MIRIILQTISFKMSGLTKVILMKSCKIFYKKYRNKINNKYIPKNTNIQTVFKNLIKKNQIKMLTFINTSPFLFFKPFSAFQAILFTCAITALTVFMTHSTLSHWIIIFSVISIQTVIQIKSHLAKTFIIIQIKILITCTALVV